MATIKVKFQASDSPKNQGTIYYQIIHERKTRRLSTQYRILPHEWIAESSAIALGDSPERELQLSAIRENIRRDLERIAEIIKHLSQVRISYSAEEIIDEYRAYTRRYSLFNYMQTLILKLRHNAQIRTSETYTATLNSFRRFRSGEDILLDCITPEIIEAFATWHKRRGNTPNTISFYARILRAVYNRAVEEGAIRDRRPFRHVYTGVEKTVKRAIPISCIRKIRELDLSQSPTLEHARDMFLLSFYLRGMSFIDMAFLRKSDLRNGYIIYRRRKTGQQLTIKWMREMQAILDKYPSNPTQYLLPIIRAAGINERSAYRNAAYNINHSLKKIAAKIGISETLTLYVARHSWASAAKEKGIPLSVISEGMGHDSEATTQIYLASLRNSIVDRANTLILRSL